MLKESVYKWDVFLPPLALPFLVNFVSYSLIIQGGSQGNKTFHSVLDLQEGLGTLKVY